MVGAPWRSGGLTREPGVGVFYGDTTEEDQEEMPKDGRDNFRIESNAGRDDLGTETYANKHDLEIGADADVGGRDDSRIGADADGDWRDDPGIGVKE